MVKTDRRDITAKKIHKFATLLGQNEYFSGKRKKTAAGNAENRFRHRRS